MFPTLPPKRLVITLGLLAGILVCGRAADAQSPSPLQIIGPLDGTVVTAGQVVVVDVSAGPSVNVSKGVSLIGTGAIGFSTADFSSLSTFALAIPAAIDPGPYAITAVALDFSNNLINSQSITLSVERSEVPIQLQVEPTAIRFPFAGEQLGLTVQAQLTGGSIADITRSTQTTYASADNLVATVSGDGLITAVGQGSTDRTTITVEYRGLMATVSVSVPHNIPGDLNGDGVVDRDDLNILLDALNTAATGTFDARDLNGDGVIDALDARALVLLCKRPGCATQ